MTFCLNLTTNNKLDIKTTSEDYATQITTFYNYFTQISTLF